jgi:CII-binding regulator of phage lambda lysogenization HflD
MATQITLTYKNEKYTLEYTRLTASAIEKQGFNLDEITTKPNIMIPLLVHGAFLRHHRDLKQKLIDEIYTNLVNKTGTEGEEGFISVLAEMYAETVSTLTDENAVDEGNAATWTVTKG